MKAERQSNRPAACSTRRCTDKNHLLSNCREFAAVSARVETVMKERNDKVTGKSRAATADDYVSVSYTLQPRRGTEAGPIWGPAGGDGGSGSSTIAVSYLLPITPWLMAQHNSIL